MKPKALVGQRGAEIVEFLLVVPFILIVFFLLVELGLGFVNQLALVNASRSAARVAIRCDDPTTQTCEDAAEAAADSAVRSVISLRNKDNVPQMNQPFDLDTSDPRCTATPPEGGCPITVTMTYPFQFFLLRAFLPVTDFELSASTTMRKLLD